MTKNIMISSNRSFGIVFFIFFLIVAIYPLFNNQDIRIWSLLISVFFLVLGLLNSSILSPLNKAWFKLGIFLGKFISPIVMGIIFFGVVTPTSFIMKLLGKNFLNIKKNNQNTYWVEKEKQSSRMKKQF